MSKTGRYGGTYAHKDIAFEFGMTAKEWRINLNPKTRIIKNLIIYQKT